MPSCVFTRTQVLESLSDEDARQEAESIPEFIYFFLRDVFLAVDEDGDGYVTGDAVSRLFPALAPVRATKDAASCPAASSLMTPTVHPTWWSPTSYVAPTRCAAASQQRPLDLCGFMQTYWPMVSDKMAHFVGDTWSRHSSDNLSDSRGQRASVNQQPILSPSPFRDVSASPLREQPTSPLAAFVTGGRLAPSPVCGSSPLMERETVSPEQHRLYREAVRCLWTSSCPLSPHALTPSPAPSVPSPMLLPCPQRLLTESDMEELLVAFSYLDRNHSGYVGVADVAAALRSLLRAAACAGQAIVSTDTPAEVSDEVLQLANAMLRMALSSTTTADEAVATQGVPASSAPSSSSGSPAVPSSSRSSPCVSWTAFARSFQCDTGAFPAELIAWCAACARASRELPARALATSPQWMSPVECAYVQQLLVSYVDLLCAEKGSVSPHPSSTATEKAQPVPAAALSPRLSVNTHFTKKPPQSCGSAGTCGDRRHSRYVCQTHATAAALQQWCQCANAQAKHLAESDMNTVPLTLLEASLRRDLQAFLFPKAFEFSAAAGAALAEVLEHHVQAVCALAQGAARLPALCHSPNARMEGKASALRGLAGHCWESVHVDLDKLVDVITADPRYLQLEVLVPLESRLTAVVDAARHHPRRLVEEAVRLISVFVHSARLGDSELADVLELRRALSTVSPSLARLITGATSFCEGRLRLEECMITISTHVLSVPPPLPVAVFPAFAGSVLPSAPVTKHDDAVMALCDHPCYAMLQDTRLLKASHGWLRYACRRMPPREQRTVIDALRLSCGSSSRGGSLFEAAARGFGVILDARLDNREQQRSLSACDVYSAMLPRVRASCWVCRMDPVVAAHATLVLIAASGSADMTDLTEESVWWAGVHTLLGQWVHAQHSRRCLLESADAWAMDAIKCTAAELGLPCCRAVSQVLSHLPVASSTASRVVVVEEEELTQSLSCVVESLSLWATPPSANPEWQSSSAAACARLVDTLVGSCPRRDSTRVDVSALLRRWLEAYPLPLPVTHVSLCCAVEEVGSVYYTLKRLAASEEAQRRRSETPAGGAAAPPRTVSEGRATATAASRQVSSAPVVTGISPVCLSELLENEDVLLALYAVSPAEAVGVWGGALCHLGALLRPVLLSSTGVRVSLYKLSGRSSESEGAVATAVPSSTSSPRPSKAISHRNGGQSSLADAILSMAVPASLQHAVAQLFACVDVEGTGAVTEDQLRSHRSRVPASARYGWHRFVTAVCSSSAMTSLPSSSSRTTPCSLISGGLSAGVLRSHWWSRRRRAAVATLSCAGEAQPQAEQASCSSVATQRTDDDVVTTYSLGDMLMRMAELRVCVQAQLLEESSTRAKAEASVFVSRKSGLALTRAITDADSPLSTAVGQKAAVSSPPTAGTAQWWATYLEELCRSYSPLAL
ncbi:hypothetical protein LMJF_35_2030 [Leishmania major strain Friedlin]|uniref:EF-hand domain-containing protein n=1 Tax=Leishmania major TaxID=5664 RepID=E9AF25_LEIMA|nr:hypothetical protein LMJF_35_2030 [Leishmania major strain Friedlin]CAG9582554.1 hypothetical_protein_-_conserved [Leishmania major strain Friedlin]CBZ12829.1 hypothetical protein LMJF_35_2030 [Leishmania major strain Friedlin]|eukprot:XP_003722595.1 hypothetical protein LMJF_35_2030 [Leishmania major strain Friedlin]